MISAKNITYAIGKRQILNNISFDAHAGELLVILGNNGAGKSTLLKAICNETKHDGLVEFNQQNASSICSKELALKRAVLKQHTQVNLPFLVEEIVMMGRYPHFKNVETPYDYQAVQEAMQKVGVLHMAKQNYLTLSGGEQQRVQLARVLAQLQHKTDLGTRYLFLDEPVSSLDIAQQHNTLTLAKAFAKEGNVVVAVLHDLNLAAMYADKILMLKQGKVNVYGNVANALTDANITSTFDFPAYVTKHPHANHLVIYFHQTQTINITDTTQLMPQQAH
jgi:iron complex transport system ATP-binding protein